MHDIAPIELEGIDVTIKLANRDTISPVGIVRDVEVLCGKVKYPADFLVLSSPQDDFCPIIFGRPFLNTASAKISCEKDTVTIGLEGMSHEFNFAKFRSNLVIENHLARMRLLVLLLLSCLLLIR